jgi:hypothetical protein
MTFFIKHIKSTDAIKENVKILFDNCCGAGAGAA